MKTLTKALFATAFAAVLLTSSAITTFAAHKIELIKPATGFKKIWVSGNIKVILTQSAQEGVFVEEDFNAEKTSVLSKGETLYLNSTERMPVTIKVALKDLIRIEAFGNAEIITDNSFNVKCLQVILNHSATAKVNAVTGSLYTNVSGNARLKMSGVTDQHTLIASNAKNVKIDNLVCMNVNKQDTLLQGGKLTWNSGVK